LSNTLVVVQIVLSLLLVVAAGLFVQTFERLIRVALGFDPDRTLVVMVTTPRSRLSIGRCSSIVSRRPSQPYRVRRPWALP
jgi:hypothetical protein